MVLDVNTPPLNGLTINGKLRRFANNKDVELTTEWIMLHGELEIGTEKAPHTRKATITFTNNVKDEDISGVGGTTDSTWTAGIMLMGGTLNLHGDRDQFLDEAVQHSERRRHLDPGPERCRLARSATRSFSHPRISIPGRQNDATLRPSAETGSRSTRSSTTWHFGKITFDVDERGEVGLP